MVDLGNGGPIRAAFLPSFSALLLLAITKFALLAIEAGAVSVIEFCIETLGEAENVEL